MSARKNVPMPAEVRARISTALKRRLSDPVAARAATKHFPEAIARDRDAWRRAVSEGQKRAWRDPEVRARRSAAIVEGLAKRRACPPGTPKHLMDDYLAAKALYGAEHAERVLRGLMRSEGEATILPREFPNN